VTAAGDSTLRVFKIIIISFYISNIKFWKIGSFRAFRYIWKWLWNASTYSENFGQTGIPCRFLRSWWRLKFFLSKFTDYSRRMYRKRTLWRGLERIVAWRKRCC
jgi:hypothetical protein